MIGKQETRRPLYATIWRWHFYAGLFVLPFVLILAATGGFYLFKPQFERWEERAYQNLPVEQAVSADAQAAAALAAFPGARLNSYRLPERAGDAAMVHVTTDGGTAMRDIFVSPQGEVLGSIASDRRPMEIAKRIHGQLLVGKVGSWLVELAASWAIVLILSGLYLWWPRGTGLAGTLWPRLSAGRRILWRDLHAVTGFWISALALVTLSTSLPWTGIWGRAFDSVRAELGMVKGELDWTLGGEAPPLRAASSADPHAGHDGASHEAMAHMGMMEMTPSAATPMISLETMVARARAEHLAFPVIVTPPGAPGRFNRPGKMEWTIRSDAQNRPLQATITYDSNSGQELTRETFADSHVIDRAVGYGIAWHEGQLFGLANQLIVALLAVGLISMTVTGFILWRRRKPDGQLGAPVPATVPARMGGVVTILLLLAALLPLLALSLGLLWLFDRFLLPHLPRLAGWLGVEPRPAMP